MTGELKIKLTLHANVCVFQMDSGKWLSYIFSKDPKTGEKYLDKTYVTDEVPRIEFSEDDQGNLASIKMSAKEG